MASKRSRSAARSERRAEPSKRVARFAARLARELGQPPKGNVDQLEAMLTDRSRMKAAQLVCGFIGLVQGGRYDRDRLQRIPLTGADFPPMG